MLNRILIRLFWFPVGFPFFVLGALTAYAIDTFNTGRVFFEKAMNDEVA